MTFVKLTTCGLLLAFGLAMSAQASTIADFNGDYIFTDEDGKTRAEASADGWDYMWNPEGTAVGTAASYASLVQDADWWSDPYCPTATFPCPWPAYVLSMGATGGHPGAGTEQVGNEHFVIAAYKIQAGEAGLVSIADSSIYNAYSDNGNGVELRVYVNDTLKTSFIQGCGAAASSFDASLGSLNVGDAVYVAVGPNGNLNSDWSELSYRLTSEPVTVPEPTTGVIALTAGLFGLLAYAWRKRR